MLREIKRDQEAAKASSGLHFQERGQDVSRLEGFSDAIFGFAITLIVVSLDPPKTFNDLLVTVLGAGSFLISFSLLVQLWLRHYQFFRRYGLNDGRTIVLNMTLLFLILFYVYPLKFLFNVAINGLVAQQFVTIAPDIYTQLGGATLKALTINQTAIMYIVYGLGFAAIYLVFALLYRHAYGQRQSLQLNELERFETVASCRESLIIASIGVLSAAIALFTHDPALPGICYFGIVAERFSARLFDGRRRKQIIAQAAVTPSASPSP